MIDKNNLHRWTSRPIKYEFAKILHPKRSTKRTPWLVYPVKNNPSNDNVIYIDEEDYYPERSATKEHGRVIFALYKARLKKSLSIFKTGLGAFSADQEIFVADKQLALSVQLSLVEASYIPP